jgi:HEAT repeat protein
MEGFFEQQASALRDPDPEIRLAAVEALGGLREERCTELLFSVLGDAEGKIRKSAIASLLGFDQDEKVIPLLIRALDGENPKRRAGAGEALICFGRRSVYPMLTMMNQFGKQVKKSIIDLLAEISDPRATPALLATLNDENEDVQVAAIEALGKIRDDRALEPLIEALRRDHPLVAFSAVKALERIGNPRAVEPLIKVLSKPILQRVALEALGRMGDLKALHFIVSHLQGGTRRSVRDSALKALTALESGQPQVSSILIVTKLREAYSKDLFGYLIGALDNPDGEVRDGAIRVLGWLGETKAISSLLPHLAGDHRQEVIGALVNMKRDAVGPLTAELVRQGPTIREGVAEVLGKIGDQKGTPFLIRLLSDDNGHVRQSAAVALGRIKDPVAIRPLLSLLGDPYPNVQGAAAGALAQIGGRTLLPSLLPLLRSEKPSVRCNAVKVLGRFGEQDAIPLIAALLNEDPISEVRKAAVEALGYFGREADSFLLAALRESGSEVRIAALKALGRRNVEDLASHLQPFLEEKEVAVRAAAIRALAQAEGDQVRGWLIQMVNDPVGAVRIAAMQVLCELKDPALTPIFFAQLTVGDIEVRKAAILALGKNGDLAGSGSIRSLLEDSGWLIRSAAARASGTLRDPRAIPRLAELADSDPDPLVRESALFALAEIDATSPDHP